MEEIDKIVGRQILDSRGNPTLEVDLFFKNGAMGRASVPSGASTGKYEAKELRDNDLNNYAGKSILKSIENLQNEITPLLVGKEIKDQQTIDKLLIDTDGTQDKSRIGANTTLAVSLAYARATANMLKLPLFESLYKPAGSLLPVPFINIINGGAHSNNSLDIQEFMIVPLIASTFQKSLMISYDIFIKLRDNLVAKGFSTAVGDEGGYAPNLDSTESAIEIILESIESAGYKPGKEIGIALDIAASELFSDGKYHLKGQGLKLSSNEMVKMQETLVNKYPIISIEDGLSEDDFDGWRNLTNVLGKKIQIIGDDLFTTNLSRLQRGIDENLANSILIKMNQIGTVSETIQAIELAMNNGYKCVVSHRSGETEDTSIADLSVATEVGQIKTGSLSRTDRTSKYNQLIRIEEYLGSKAKFNPEIAKSI